MQIKLVGLSYKTTPLELREKFYVSPDQIPDFLVNLRTVAPEAILFSTCNRFEILTHGGIETTSLIQAISDYCKLPQEQFEHLMYQYEGLDAVRHVFRVAASLDSIIIGEAQILGQLKHFFTLAQEQKSVGPPLHTLMERAFMVAKKVRSETMIASNPVSIPSVAVELASRIFGTMEDKTALIIGAGKMGLLSLQHLQAHGIHRFLITNRTFSKAEELAHQIQGRAIPFDDINTVLAEADIVIGSSGSPNFVLQKEHVEKAMLQRKNRPMFLIDIAVPRNMDPQIHKIGNVFLYDIDDLETVSQKNRSEREKEAVLAEEIVRSEAETFWRKLQGLDVNPTIRQIHAGIQEVCKQELSRTLSKMGSVTQEQQQKIEALVSRLSDRILQCPFSELRQLAGQPESVEKIDFIGRLFQVK
jgi:glutamyl-tRNA reductase